MKFTNKENRKNVLYISKSDVETLQVSNYHIPTEATGEIFDSTGGYYKITDEKEIEYLMGLDFIVDYRKENKKTVEEIDEEIKLLRKKIRSNLTYCQEMPDRYMDKIIIKLKEARLMEYQKDALLDMKLEKSGSRVIHFPEVVDSESLNLTITSSNYSLLTYMNNDMVVAVKKDKSKDGDIDPELLRIYRLLTHRENDEILKLESAKGTVLYFLKEEPEKEESQKKKHFSRVRK